MWGSDEPISFSEMKVIILYPVAKSVDQPAPVKIELGKNILRSLLGLEATLYEK